MKAGTLVRFGLAAATAWVAGCYSFTGASVPPHLKTLAIPTIDDQSTFGEPGVREQMTTELTTLFLTDNSFQVADRGTADAVLKGVITSITDAPAAVGQGETVRSRRITMSAKFTFQDMKFRKTLWEKTFSNWGDYPVTGGSSQRRVGLDEAMKKITEDVLLETVSGW
jgi:hypothetical protein